MSVTAAELNGMAPTLQQKGSLQAPADAAATGRAAGASCGAVAAWSLQEGTTQVSASAQSGGCAVAVGQAGRRPAASPAAGGSPASAADTLSAASAVWNSQPHRQPLDGCAAAPEERPQQQLPHSNAAGPSPMWIRSRQDGRPDAAAAVTLQGQAAEGRSGLLRSSSSRCDSDNSWQVDEGEGLDDLDAAFEAEGEAGKESSCQAADVTDAASCLGAADLRKATLSMPGATLFRCSQDTKPAA